MKVITFIRTKKQFFLVVKIFIVLISLFVLGSALQSRSNAIVSTAKVSYSDTAARYSEPSHFSSQPLKLLKAFTLPLSPATTRNDIDTPITKKVLVLNFNPTVKSSNNLLSVVHGWSDPNALLTQYISDLKTNSGGVANYTIVQNVVIDSYPQLADGFQYTDSTYLTCLNSGGTLCHNPNPADYIKILKDNQVCEMSNAGQIDEVWLFGGPWFGFWEANMAGLNSFDTNGPPIKIGTTCTKNLNIMGFSYERGVPEMLEDFIHRIEGTMIHMNTTWKTSLDKPPYTYWDKYTFISAYPLSADFPYYGLGDMHFPANISKLNDPYNYTSLTSVTSNYDDWYNFPNFTSVSAQLNCTAWGCNGYGYEGWWLSHLPRYLGTSPDGRYNDWWKYAIDFDNSYVPSCNQVPVASTVSPLNNYQYTSDTTGVIVTGHAIFNTCNGTRQRQIWVRDVTLNQNFSELCYYNYDTADLDYGCSYTGLAAGHQYEWIATANNESYTAASATQAFSIAPLPTPTPTPDKTAPTVRITSPANNSSVSRNANITIVATAVDNVAVAKVEFSVNGIIKCTKTVSPYTCSWTVPSTRGKYTLSARAYDTSGNSSISSVTVTSK